MPKRQEKRGPKTEAERDPVVQRIFRVTGWTSERQMCHNLEVAQTTLSRRRKAGKGVPHLWLRVIAGEYDRHLRWLETGEGPEVRDDPTIRSLSPDLRMCLDIGRTLSETAQTHLAEAAEFFREGDPRDINYFTANVHEHVLNARERRVP